MLTVPLSKAIVIILLTLAAISVWSQPAEEALVRGERLAQSLCIACHGPRGMSVSPIWPSIAGQQRSYLVKTLKDYRSGVRQDPLMTPQSQILTDAQIEDMADYYSSFKIQIVEPGESNQKVSTDEN